MSKDIVKNRVIIFDLDEFFAQTVDLILFNFSLEESVNISDGKKYKQFLESLNEKQFEGNYYLIDEIFGKGKVDISELIEKIRKADAKAYIIGCTQVGDGEMENKDLYDEILVKGLKDKDKSVVKVLADVLGKEYVEDNSDPEYKGFVG